MAQFPRLYAILDANWFHDADDPAVALAAHARLLIEAGVTLLQYRNPVATPRQMLAQARELRRVVAAMDAPDVRLIMQGRADLCLAADFDGVHLEQHDPSPPSVRSLLAEPGANSTRDRSVGISGHNPAQIREADQWPVDYIVVGPVFANAGNENPDPALGLEGIKLARALTAKPIVAFGGITLANCRDLLAAGADSVAVIAALMANPLANAREFLENLKD